jgi:hypothetical protein
MSCEQEKEAREAAEKAEKEEKAAAERAAEARALAEAAAEEQVPIPSASHKRRIKFRCCHLFHQPKRTPAHTQIHNAPALNIQGLI